ncbi:MAG: ribonuclease HI [Oscillospiraceae bacterium]|jgi:ribonuclease HI|nr:ribonuclease HI [Oscillospiraceae bacterium]
MKKVTVYTDGACSGNPGPGGWGAVLIYGGERREISGGAALTTNNRMELTGVIEALGALKEPCQVTAYTDSKYVTDAINKHWLDSWARQNWRKKGGEVKNPELWQALLPLLERHDVTFVWVKGHAENEYNNRCDELAVAESRRARDS